MNNLPVLRFQSIRNHLWNAEFMIAMNSIIYWVRVRVRVKRVHGSEGGVRVRVLELSSVSQISAFQ